MLISMRFYNSLYYPFPVQTFKFNSQNQYFKYEIFKTSGLPVQFCQLALNTKFLLDKLKIKKADIVGDSRGGMLATTFTINYSSFVKKLILINPIGLEAYGKCAQFKDVNFFL